MTTLNLGTFRQPTDAPNQFVKETGLPCASKMKLDCTI